MNLPSIPADKANHFVYGAALSILGFTLGALVGFPPGISGAAFAVGFGLGKEVYDRVSGSGTPDPLDFVWTALGALPALVASGDLVRWVA